MATTDRLPCDLESERAFLGMLINHPQYVENYANALHDTDFYRHANALIYASILRLSASHKAVDMVSVVADLREYGHLADAGGIAEISAITQYAVPDQIGGDDAERTRRYFEIILECARRRDGYRIFQTAAQRAVSGEDLESLLTLAREQLPKAASQEAHAIDSDLLADKWANWYLETKEKGECPGIRSGFPFLDKMTGGWQKSTLIILGARPNMGKTALALNFAVNACKKGASVMVFSLEMTDIQLCSRIIASEGRVDASHANIPALMSSAEDKAASIVLGKLHEWKLNIDDESALPVSKIFSRARNMQRERGLDMIVIDHLNYIGSEGQSENRTNEMRKITAALKAMAKELQIPVIVLCQLSRGVESRNDKHPTLADLRESGTIEQDADIVLLLYRDAYYTQDLSDKSAELQIAKHRNGRTGTIQLRFDGEHQKFSQVDVQFWNSVKKGDIPA